MNNGQMPATDAFPAKPEDYEFFKLMLSYEKLCPPLPVF